MLYTYKAVEIPGFVFVWGRTGINIEVCYEQWNDDDAMYVQSSYDSIEFVNDDGFTEGDQLATIGWLAQDWYNQHLGWLSECEYCGSHSIEGGK
ncbi:MAG: hypothetical protein EBR73_12315 [Rhodobacteraceae bacterium]|nr:hypothetical protein [Paracoccaceae bacterium]